jgi:hypothetical protein
MDQLRKDIGSEYHVKIVERDASSGSRVRVYIGRLNRLAQLEQQEYNQMIYMRSQQTTRTP